MKRRQRRLQTCRNPRCQRGEGGRPQRFASSNPASYCSPACRQAVSYEAKKRERLVELGLIPH